MGIWSGLVSNGIRHTNHLYSTEGGIWKVSFRRLIGTHSTEGTFLRGVHSDDLQSTCERGCRLFDHRWDPSLPHIVGPGRPTALSGSESVSRHDRYPLNTPETRNISLPLVSGWSCLRVPLVSRWSLLGDPVDSL